MANGYRNTLVQQIKDAGQELINRAESMVHPENDLITDFSMLNTVCIAIERMCNKDES